MKLVDRIRMGAGGLLLLALINLFVGSFRTYSGRFYLAIDNYAYSVVLVLIVIASELHVIARAGRRKSGW